MTPLDTLASRAVYAARLFERAIHDEGPWTIRWGPYEVPAQRVETDEAVLFEATFPEACYLAPPEPTAVLLCRGEVQAVKAIDHPGDTAFCITWSLVAKVMARDSG